MNKNNILSISFDKIQAYLEANENKDAPVVDYQTPDEMRGLIDFQVNKKGVSEDEFLGLIDSYLNYSVKTGNKQFLNQLYAGFNFPAYIGEMFTLLANTSMYTYEVAPVATLIESEMIQLMNSYSGYKNGDGIFLSGGSNANLIAMFSARNRFVPESRKVGLDREIKLKAFVSDQAHYSFETAANVLGIGAENVIKVRSDKQGRMIVDELECEILKSKERGEKPFFVAATCGTTLLGAYDPINELALVCEKFDLWFHADGSFGGSILLSDQHRYLMKGIEKTDSFTWNPHKLMNIPLICSALLVKEKGVLQKNITDINSDYIFHDIEKIEDLGKKSIQCGRSVDSVKLWFAWKFYGLKGYQNRIDNLINMAAYAEEIVNNNKWLEIFSPRQSFSICFRYVPELKTDINAFNLAIRESMRKKGISIVNYAYIGQDLVIRLITANGELESSDIDLFFKNLLSTANLLEKRINKKLT